MRHIRSTLRGVAGAVLAFATFAGASAQSQDAARAPLVVPWTDIEPYAYQDRDGVAGLFADLARELGRRLDRDVSFRHFETALAQAAAQTSGETDMLPGVATLPFLRENNVFSDPLARTQVRILVPTENVDAIDPETVSGLRIGYVPPIAGSATTDFLARNEGVPYEQMALALVHLLQGRLDGLLVPEGPMLALTRTLQLDHRVQAIGKPLLVYDRVVALSKRHADLLPAINDAIADMEADGTLDRIRSAYQMGVPPPPPATLTVGATHFPPYQVIEADGRITGFAVEVLRDLAIRADLDLRFVPIDAASFGAGPGPDRYDMLPQTAITPERQARMDFTLPIETDTWSLFAARDRPDAPASLDELSGKTVAVTANNNGRRLAESVEGSRLLIVGSVDEIIDALLDGRADVGAYATATLQRALERRNLAGRIVVRGEPLQSTMRAPALRIGLGVVRERVNGVIPGYLVSEEYRAHQDAWFGEPNFWTSERTRWGLVGLGSVVILLACLSAFQAWRQRLHDRYTAEVEAANARLDRQNTELANLNADLARSNRELDEFAFIASHDLKEPLRGISINANLLSRSGGLDDKAHARVERMIALCVRADELVSALLLFARLGKPDDKAVRSRTREVLDDTVRLIQETIEAANGEVVVETALPDVAVAPDKLAIVFRNLILNGLKYNRSGRRTVAIGFVANVEVEGCSVRNAFYARDNGVGIDPTLRDKLFRVFSRLHPVTEFGPGTGIGLSMVKRVVEDHRGTITFSSAPGGGTTFYFTMPLAGAMCGAHEQEIAA